MRRICLLALCLCAFGTTAVRPVAAQPSVTVMHAGVDRLYEDLELIFVKLGAEPAQYKTLKEDVLDVFFIGVDPKKPALVQIYVRSGKFNTVLHAPVTVAKQFRDNMRALGLKNKIVGAGLYQVSSLFDGFLKESPGVTIIGADRKDVTGPAVDLAKVAQRLGLPEHDFVAEISNDDKIADRKAAVQQIRKELLAGIKQLPMESSAEFALRKTTLEQQLSEIEQIYSEAKLILTTGSVVTEKSPQLVSETKLTPLPDTPLAANIAAFGKTPSLFAALPFSNTLPLSSRIDYALDEMRKEHAAHFLKQSRPLVLKRIKDNSTHSEKTKAYLEQTASIIFDILEHSTTAGRYDAMVDVKPQGADGLHSLVGGVRVDGAVVLAGLEKIKDSTAVTLNKEKVGEVSLHQVTLPGDLEELQKVFGKQPVLWVGTAPDVVWFAVGENAEAELKQAIAATTAAAAKEPVADPQIIQLHVQAGLWMDLFDAIRDKQKIGKKDARQIAIDAFKAGGDTFDFSMQRVGDSLILKLNLHEGILRYGGKAGARIVKENLQ